MGKKKNTKNVEKPKRYAGVRFSMDEYYTIGTDGENITMTSDINGVTKEYDVTGGSGTTIEPLEVTANGTYEAPTGTAYSPVTVNVGDEYEEVTLWTNPDPSKGLKVDTEIATIEAIQEQNIEYIKIRYRNINNRPDQVMETTFVISQLTGDDCGAGALVSTGDYDQTIDRSQYYARPVFYDANWGGIYFLGQCREVSAAATDKNFRAVPEVVYGYKLKEV